MGIIGKGSQIHSPYTISSATTTTATTFKRERNNVQSTTILQSRNRQNYIRDRSKQKLDESEMSFYNQINQYSKSLSFSNTSANSDFSLHQSKKESPPNTISELSATSKKMSLIETSLKENRSDLESDMKQYLDTPVKHWKPYKHFNSKLSDNLNAMDKEILKRNQKNVKFGFSSSPNNNNNIKTTKKEQMRDKETYAGFGTYGYKNPKPVYISSSSSKIYDEEYVMSNNQVIEEKTVYVHHNTINLDWYNEEMSRRVNAPMRKNQPGQFNHVVDLFYRMKKEGVTPDRNSYMYALRACDRGNIWKDALNIVMEKYYSYLNSTPSSSSLLSSSSSSSSSSSLTPLTNSVKTVKYNTTTTSEIGIEESLTSVFVASEKRSKFVWDLVQVNICVEILCRTAKYMEIFSLLEQIYTSGTMLRVSTFNIILASMQERFRWQGMIKLLDLMSKYDVIFDSDTYTYAISANLALSNAREATRLLVEMDDRGYSFPPSTISMWKMQAAT